jgi:hypothetical protein
MAHRRDIGRAAIERRSFRLEPGSHDSPGDGVCVVELASVIAGESFSDRPRCVCEVIAAFLRGWNDRSSHAARQRLLPYASRVVGSRAGRRVTHMRRDICLTWAGADLTGNPLSRAVTRLAMRARISVLCGLGSALRLDRGAGELAARVLFSQYGPETGFSVVDSLLAVGSETKAGYRNGNGSASASRDPDAMRDLIERALRPAEGAGAEEPREPARVA